MWIAKLKINHKECWISKKTSNYNVKVYGYPLSSYVQEESYYHNSLNLLVGSKSDIEQIINELKTDKRVTNLEIYDNWIFATVNGKDNIANMADASFFHIKPVLMENGFEYWEIGSHKKKLIEEFVQKSSRICDISIIKIKKEHPDFYLFNSFNTSLTDKQKEAFNLAKNNGYYSYPRKTNLKELARVAKTPRTTLQSHLRKAEKKILSEIVLS